MKYTNSQKIFNYLQERLGEHLRLLLIPYKRDMWDCFEGIYHIANSTEGCSAHVCPIPYTVRTSNGSVGKWFMDDWSIISSRDTVDYQKKPKKGEYDAILFHNPYDNANYVTSVHPAYYSDRLRGLSRALCLVPYGIGTICLITPGVVNSDIVFAESKKIVKSFRSQIIAEGALEEEADLICQKFVVTGSPKLDLNMDQPVPDEWIQRIKGKKVVMLATTVSAFLKDPAEEMAKVGKVIREFCNRDDVVLIWREHPLMKATIVAMRPQYIEEYGKFQKNYTDQNLGILDKTQDYRIAFSVADVLYTDPSSLIYTWEQTGKEIHII